MSEANFSNDAWQSDPPAWDPLERIVRAASQYVQPTDDLRPRIIEAARSASSQRRHGRHFGVMAMLVVLLSVTGVPAFLLSLYPELAVVTGGQLYHRAELRVFEQGAEPNWALSEAFSELRHEHSARLYSAD